MLSLLERVENYWPNGGGLNITKFTLGDDEIDYSLYEPNHILKEAYYDESIK